MESPTAVINPKFSFHFSFPDSHTNCSFTTGQTAVIVLAIVLGGLAVVVIFVFVVKKRVEIKGCIRGIFRRRRGEYGQAFLRDEEDPDELARNDRELSDEHGYRQ